jgi:alanine-synthesizing transaminase
MTRVMRFSRRLPADLTSSPLALELSRRSDAVDLTESNPTSVGFIAENLSELLAAPGSERYEPEPRGLVSTRQAIVRYAASLGVATSVERLLVTASTSEAYALILKLLCDPGDRIAVPSPSYPLVDVLAGLELVEVVRYGLIYDGRWRLDLDSVRATLEAGARAVVVVQPNNPTGSVLTPTELAALEELAAMHDAAIISDEVFRPYPLDARLLPTFAGVRRALTFVLDGLSKGAALPQLKLGWMSVFGPEGQVADAVSRLEWIADAYLSVATPVQRALPALLAGAPSIVARIRDRVRENRAALVAALDTVSAVEVLHQEGGWCAVLRVPGTCSEDELVTRLAADAKVKVHPGYFYDFADDGYLVLGLLQPPEIFAPAARRLASALADLMTTRSL